MIKKVLALVMLSTALFANSFNLNSNIGSFELSDQFENKHTVNSDIETIVFSTEKDTSAALNEFLATKEKGFLEVNKTAFIADISGMPSIISYMFALPKMKKYNYNVLLIEEEGDKRFLKEEGKLTVYKLENGIVKSINYVDPKNVSTIF